MKFLQSIFLGFCASIVFTTATAAAGDLNVGITIPQADLDFAIQQATNKAFNTNTLKAITALSQNPTWFFGSALVGFMGFDLLRKSIHTMCDKAVGLNTKKDQPYGKLIAKAAIGGGLMGMGGYGIYSIIK